jgi:ribose 1,5-bisphosphate isomerase
MSLIKTYQGIKSLKIQGATAVAEAIISELRHQGLKSRSKSYRSWYAEMHWAASYLLSARPTEPMAQNLSRLLLVTLQSVNEVEAGQNLLKKIANDILDFIHLGQENIVRYGQGLIKSGDRIFTHCHSATVEKILVASHNSGKKIRIFNTETRPLYQGHITAQNLVKHKIKVTMVADSAAGFLITSYSGKEILVDKILLGADVIFSHGVAVNKIGSFNIALAAAEEKVPLYIVAHLLKTDDDGKIEIERRPAKEIWAKAPSGLEIVNFAFDVMPAKYITGFITEFGILKPQKIHKVIKKNYPWLLRK